MSAFTYVMQVLMTKAMRERQSSGSRTASSASIRVRMPEGLLLQVCQILQPSA